MLVKELESTNVSSKLSELFFPILRDSKPKLDIYKLIIDDLDAREKDELTRSIDILKTKTKYSILRIITKYNLFTSFLAESETIDRFFLHSNEAKIRLLTTGCIFGDLSKINTDTLVNEKLVAEKKFIMLTPNDYETELSFIEANVSNLYWWRGCEMKIPLEAKITLGFNKLFFSVFIKSKETNDEIFVEESSWNVTYVHNNEDFVNEENMTPSFGSIETGFEHENAQNRTMIINKKDNLEYLDKGTNAKSSNKKDFLSVDIDILKALKDCDVVVQMPYQHPRVDALMKVKFSDAAASEIILTCP